MADYEVGYGKPPKRTQFQKGRSPNPGGRPKGSKNRNTVVLEEANAKINVTIDGRPQKMTMFQAAFKQQMAKAVGGDGGAFKLVSPMLGDAEARSESTLVHQLAEIDRAMLASIMQQYAAFQELAELGQHITLQRGDSSGVIDAEESEIFEEGILSRPKEEYP